MKRFQSAEPQLFAAFVKLAQYLVRLNTQQDVCQHLGKFLVTYFPADWVAFVERDAAQGSVIAHCTLSPQDAAHSILTDPVRKLVAEVLESGFLASQVIPAPAPSMTVFLPILEEYHPSQVLLIGHATADPLPKDWLNLYLAIAGLAGTTFERLRNQRELHRHRAHLEQLVTERTAEIHRQKELLAVTLASIGDGVIVTDAQGNVTFLNAEGQRLTGWSNQEAQGQALPSVFKIINEETRQSVQSPVEKVLRLGTVVNLANHTLLIARDGTETPIDDSGAPICGSDGTILGVVLVFRDFSERRLAETRLQAAKVALEHASAAKDQFIATLSHELRTPLTPVLAAAGSMLQDSRLPVDVREDLELVQRNVELEVALISDLLDVTRIAAGKLVLDKRPVDVAQVLRHAARICSVDLDGRSQTLTIETPDDPYPMAADASRLHQVFWNLIKNAIKFTPHGGRITVQASVRDQVLRVVVQDNGVGIEPDVLPKLFNHFEQGEGGTTRQFGGLGLGLAIAKAVVTMHGGNVTAHSQGKDQGATFVVQLPLSLDLRTRLPQPVDGTQATTAPDRLIGPCPTQFRILLVEDHADTAKLMARLLSAKGHQVIKADCVQAALCAAEHNDFDLLISDLGLPDGTGYELMRQLMTRGKSIRAIALSGYGTAADMAKSREAGFAEHLVKPVDLQALHAALHRVMRQPQPDGKP